PGTLACALGGSVSSGPKALASVFNLGCGSRNLSVDLGSPAGKLSLQVTDPSGRSVGAGYPGARMATDQGLTALTVDHPPSGHYAVAVLGISTGPSGAPYAVTASTDGHTGTQHLDEVVSGAA